MSAMNKNQLIEALVTGKYKDLPGDEPIFLLWAHDCISDEAIVKWALVARAMDVHTDKVKSAMDAAEEMRDWHTRKIPD